MDDNDTQATQSADAVAPEAADSGSASGSDAGAKRSAVKRTQTARKAPAAKRAAAAKKSAGARKKAAAVTAPAETAPAATAPAATAPAAKAPAVKAPSASGPVSMTSSGHAEANSEQELADLDHGTSQDEKMDSDLSADGDQSVGAVAAFARSVAAVAAPVAAAAAVAPVAAAVAPVAAAAPAASSGPASAEDIERAWTDNRLAQVLYHDWEAETYDEKWSISFDDRCISYARDRFSALLGPEVLRAEAWPYGKSLEIGAGTGFFSLNLKQAGVLDEVHVSDISGGMVASAQRNARNLGFEVTGTVSGAESLPYEDNTFDIVLGHAVIHHIPDVEVAVREILRVLKPGGRFVIAGEPTRIGEWYARRLGRITWELTTRVTKLKPLRERWARSKEELDESSRAAALEAVVDLHTFVPAELADLARRAGAANVHTQTEELLAAFVGWPVRTFEAAVNPDRLGWGWSMFAYRSWQRLSAVDRVLSKAVPQQLFYNVGVTGTKP